MNSAFPPAPRWRVAGRWALLAAALALAFTAACADWREVFPGERRVFFVDADCYARMTRVRAVCEHPGLVLTAHEFENYPFGTRPHTTALFDYLVWALSGVIGVFTRGVDARDLAGAWVSPVLGLLAVAAGGVWANRARLPGRVPMFLVLAGSPILAHGFALGRPDHQSLVLACMAWALAAEWALWRAPSRGWGWVSGVAWALGLWTSLYEPAVLLAVVLATGLAFNRPSLWQRARLPGLAVGGVILLAALLVEGWRLDALPGFGRDAPLFAAWSRQVEELRSVAPWDGVIFRWTGWGIVAAPLLLLLPRREPEETPSSNLRRQGLAQAVLLLTVWALTCWQVRWGYFLPLVYAMTIPTQLGALPVRWRPAAAALLVAALWPLAGFWYETASPPAEAAAVSAEKREDNFLLREAAEFIGRAPSAEPGSNQGILAPWWLCPPLAYWSGQPAVAGSSHESLEGIGDTALFYLEPDARAAAAILRRRKVRWVVVYEPDRALRKAAELYGRTLVPTRAMGNLLYIRPDYAPRFLHPAFQNRYFKVYEVVPAVLP